MGATQSNVQMKQALQLFSEAEQVQLSMLFKELSHRTHGESSIKKKSFDGNHFKLLSNPYISEHLSKNLCAYMRQCETDAYLKGNLITEVGFVISVSNILKGTIFENSGFLCCLASGNTDHCMLKELSQTLDELAESLVVITEASNTFASWFGTSAQRKSTKPKLIRSWMHELYATNRKIQSEVLLPADDATFIIDQINTWLQRSPMLLTTLHSVMHGIFPITLTTSIESAVREAPKFPSLSGTQNKAIILDVLSILYINHQIPSDLQNEWHLLFSSNLHGESFSTLSKRAVDSGPSLFVIQDKEGYIFGGFLSQNIQAGPKFCGNAKCFVFQAEPFLEVYHATGLNENYFYFNMHQQMMPNGMGFGGQLSYFGLWIDVEYGKGHSKGGPKCTTYGSPQLSKSADFHVDFLEVWRVGPEKKRMELSSGFWGKTQGSGSILDKDPEAKAMLSFIDRGTMSDGVREPVPTPSNSEKH